MYVSGRQTSSSYGVSFTICSEPFSSLSTSTPSSSTCSSGASIYSCNNFSFRSILIGYARGLVLKGRPNLRLFNQLYWVLFSGFCTIGIILFPILKLAQGNFNETNYGKICLLEQPETDSVGIKHSIMAFAPVGLGTVYKMFMNYKVHKKKLLFCVPIL